MCDAVHVLHLDRLERQALALQARGGDVSVSGLLQTFEEDLNAEPESGERAMLRQSLGV